MQNTDKNNFDQYANNYRKIHSQNIRYSGAKSEYFSEYKIKIVTPEIKNISNASILDFGCGDGTSAFFFKKHIPDCRLTCLDTSKESIELARNKQISDAEFKIFDGKNIPYADSEFNVIFAANVLHHIHESCHLGILHEFSRVLKKSGRIFIFEHNPKNPVTRMIVKDCIFDRFALLINSKKLESLAGTAGFSNIRTSFHIFFPRHACFSIFHCLEKFLIAIPIGAQYCVSAFKS